MKKRGLDWSSVTSSVADRLAVGDWGVQYASALRELWRGSLSSPKRPPTTCVKGETYKTVGKVSAITKGNTRWPSTSNSRSERNKQRRKITDKHIPRHFDENIKHCHDDR